MSGYVKAFGQHLCISHEAVVLNILHRLGRLLSRCQLLIIYVDFPMYMYQ